MKRLAPSFIASAALGFLLFSSDRADACSPACGIPKLVPAAGSSVPASAPGFLVTGSSGSQDSPAVELLDSNGAVVPGSFQKDSASGRTYFAPSSALTPGSYSTRGPKACSGSETVDAAFTVTASAALPTATGGLSLKKFAREDLSASTSSGSCTEPVDAAYADLALALDPVLAPFVAIATFQTTVDGDWWSAADPIAWSVAPEGSARSYLRIFTPCDGKTPLGRDRGLTAGTHTVEVRAFLPGGGALSPATITIDLSCDGAIVGDGEIPGATGGEGTDFGGGSESGSGPRGSTVPAGSGSSSGAQDGCSATPHLGASSASITTALVALLALAGLRRRRNTLDS